MSIQVTLRNASGADLPEIVRLLADDPLGRGREIDSVPLCDDYRDAFARMSRQAGNEVLVAEVDGCLVGCLQITMIDGLSRLGTRRAQIEGMRVDPAFRSKGIGEQLLLHAIDAAETAECGLVQLTTDISRPGAKRFYERLGFSATHHGMKLLLV